MPIHFLPPYLMIQPSLQSQWTNLFSASTTFLSLLVYTTVFTIPTNNPFSKLNPNHTTILGRGNGPMRKFFLRIDPFSIPPCFPKALAQITAHKITRFLFFRQNWCIAGGNFWWRYLYTTFSLTLCRLSLLPYPIKQSQHLGCSWKLVVYQKQLFYQICHFHVLFMSPFFLIWRFWEWNITILS